MALVGAYGGIRVESASVVCDREQERMVVKLAVNTYETCLSMPDGVGDEFAYDAKDGVGGSVVHMVARHVEAYLRLNSDCNRRKRLSYRRREVIFVKRVFSKIP